MAKAASPIRLQDDIMQAATLAGKRNHRSAAEQIEYWAEMGRKVAAFLNPDDLLSVSAGLAKIRLEPVFGVPLDADTVFCALEAERSNGSLSQTVTRSSVRYQVSPLHPGYLEQIDGNGVRVTGQFENGEFIAVSETAFKTAKIFMNGRSQALRLPKEFRFDTDEVYITTQGENLLISPKKPNWDDFFNTQPVFSEDFLADRQDVIAQERDFF
ncbi:type II toxin-antitoxin system VapB family antitoxin [Crenothrix polyspora]|uniref:Virulence-associated protein B (Modular protein) n=1 Tax=Crenothrix polyspora TaxID=360316 RepID=A0A1R4H4I7_9GAMM|nr:type II toxin-antitoxin system VapB family antitoxin [Crenothrix polyspora]SJM90740.1 Virulence-associated protein B (modular protein) [Crenothrix polyspora]